MNTKGDNMDWREFKLDNGLKIIYQKSVGVYGVSVGVFVGVGSRYEEKKIYGISHFLEHLLFKGTAGK